MADTILRATGIQKGFMSGGRRIEVLTDVGLEIQAGTSTSIRGESGCGKTTLLNILSLLEYPDSGDVWWGDTKMVKRGGGRVSARRGRHIGMIFQSYYLIPEIDALENVLIAARVVGNKPDRARARALLERVGLAERMRSSPPTLSGGERQRVAVARALMNAPAVVLADEPTGNLDERVGGAIMELLLEVTREAGTALVLVTHNPEFAARTDSQLMLHEGRLTSA